MVGRCGAMNQQLTDAIKEYNDNGYYKHKLEIGLEYQDLVTKALYQRGIVVIGYSSRRYQIDEGENMLGAEIKRDDQFRVTGNLYIEIDEKSHPENKDFIPSGIHREDNSWLYVIGDEKKIYIFSTKYLRMLQKNYRVVPNKTLTSHGFLMPIVDAEKYAIRIIEL